MTEIGLEISADGSSVCFTQEMTNTYVKTSYPRVNKEPKDLNKIPVHGPDIPFMPNKALEPFDRLVAVDTNTRLIRGEQVSVTGVVEGIWNWVADKDGLHRAVRYGTPFCLEFLGIKVDPEQLGWLMVISELMKEPPYQRSKRVGLIVDSGLDKLDVYNTRRCPIYGDALLPRNFTLVYATSDAGREYAANFLLRAADTASNKVLQLLDAGEVSLNPNTIVGAPYTAFRKIRAKAA
ncbi:MAG: hypothetical protein O7C73_08250 [Nitrospirae bacterium]|nr:hypothetical protein [Nitrospirota bacterium]